jgi:hypothetical protein
VDISRVEAAVVDTVVGPVLHLILVVMVVVEKDSIMPQAPARRILKGVKHILVVEAVVVKYLVVPPEYIQHQLQVIG